MRRWSLGWLLVATATGCVGDDDRDFDEPRLVKRAHQARFSPEDFTFAKLQVADGEADGLFGTCLHVPMRDAKQKMHDCDLGITLPIYVRGEKWPRDKSDAAKHAARAANAVRKHLLQFTHADVFTCRAFGSQMRAYLAQRRPKAKARWRGADVMRCEAYLGNRLPDFPFSGGNLLVGDYRAWSMQPIE